MTCLLLLVLTRLDNRNLEKKVINICKESGINLNPYDIEACHRLASVVLSLQASSFHYLYFYCTSKNITLSYK